MIKMSEKYSGSRAERPELTIVGSHAHLFENPRMKGLLDEYRDLLPTLNEVVAELQVRAGVRKPKAIPNVIGVENSVVEQEVFGKQVSAGSFHPDSPNTITLNGDYVAEMYAQVQHSDVRALARARHSLFKVLIHESLHAISETDKPEHRGAQGDVRGLAVVREDVTGLAVVRIEHVRYRLPITIMNRKFHIPMPGKIWTVNRYGSALNEVTTEHLACVAYAEALRRQGGRPLSRSNFELANSDQSSNSEPYSAYQHYRAMWYQLLEQKSKEFGIPESVVWEIVVKQYFKNDMNAVHFLENLIGSPSERKAGSELENDFALHNYPTNTDVDRVYLLNPIDESRHIEATRLALFKK